MHRGVRKGKKRIPSTVSCCIFYLFRIGQSEFFCNPKKSLFFLWACVLEWKKEPSFPLLRNDGLYSANYKLGRDFFNCYPIFFFFSVSLSLDIFPFLFLIRFQEKFSRERKNGINDKGYPSLQTGFMDQKDRKRRFSWSPFFFQFWFFFPLLLLRLSKSFFETLYQSMVHLEMSSKYLKSFLVKILDVREIFDAVWGKRMRIFFG